MKKLLISVIVGIIFGGIISKFLFVGSFLNLILWGIVGILFGAWASNRKDALINGIIYGFLLFFTFILSGYSGNAPIVTRIPFFIIIGLLGSIFGLITSITGFYARKFITQYWFNNKS